MATEHVEITMPASDTSKVVESPFTFTVYYDETDPAQAAIAGTCIGSERDIQCIPLSHCRGQLNAESDVADEVVAAGGNAQAIEISIPSPVLIMLTTLLTVDEMRHLASRGFKETRVFVPVQTQADIDNFKYASLVKEGSFYAIRYDDFFDYFPIQGMSAIKIAWNLLIWSGKMDVDPDARIAKHYNREIGSDLRLGMLVKHKSYFKAACEVVRSTSGVDLVDELIAYGRAIKHYDDNTLIVSLKSPITFTTMHGNTEVTIRAIYSVNETATLTSLDRVKPKMSDNDIIMIYQYNARKVANEPDGEKYIPGYSFVLYATNEKLELGQIANLLTGGEITSGFGWLTTSKFHKRFPAI
ncbi:hypothetical protein F-S17_0076 [Faustovirus]|nr:hypothetical protein F-S17_0076 [Faustovirus]QJX72852.1 hypothetical protein F-VV57_0090 [Faustovirus]QJX73358.1 hypothetical protein F-VV63_0092 [Faustovirus]